eukprot:Hpha_TRINITY_DN1338_c0_g1::TRINITY_DN1338_c0_g1_i1::g.93448::m.93448
MAGMKQEEKKVLNYLGGLMDKVDPPRLNDIPPSKPKPPPPHVSAKSLPVGGPMPTPSKHFLSKAVLPVFGSAEASILESVNNKSTLRAAHRASERANANIPPVERVLGLALGATGAAGVSAATHTDVQQGLRLHSLVRDQKKLVKKQIGYRGEPDKALKPQPWLWNWSQIERTSRKGGGTAHHHAHHGH